MKFEERDFTKGKLQDIDPKELNLLQECLYKKPFYKHLYREANQFMKKMILIRHDEKVRSSSVVRALDRQYPTEGLRIDDLAFVRSINQNKGAESMLPNKDRGKPALIDFRLFISKDFENAELLPADTLVVFKPHHAFMFKDADLSMFMDRDLKPKVLFDDMPLEEVERVTDTLDFLSTHIKDELLQSGVKESNLEAVFGNIDR